MNAKSKSSKSSKSSRKYKKNYTRSAKSSSRSFTKKVQSIIHRDIENKTLQFTSGIASIVPYNNLNFGSLGWMLPLSPNINGLDIPIGTGSGARIGNSITLRKLTFKGVIYPMPYNSSTNPNPMPQEVKFWIVHDKLNPATAVTGTWGTFFQNGSSSGTFSSNLTDMIQQVNTDRFTVHLAKTFKIGYAYNSGTAGSTSGQANAQYFANSDFQLNHKFSIDLTKYMPKHIKYNDASQVPMSRGLFLVVECVRADGTSSSGAQAYDVPISFQFQNSIIYEDA